MVYHPTRTEISIIPLLPHLHGNPSCFPPSRIIRVHPTFWGPERYATFMAQVRLVLYL